MNEFEYIIPQNLSEALPLLTEKNTVIKAGGIDMLDLMKEEILHPQHMISIRKLPELQGIRVVENGDVEIGAGSTLTDLARSAVVRKQAPALADAAGQAATPQVRNVATLGGNLCQRPRCWYFRSDDFNCSRKGGDTCFALDGENQYHAILGNSDGCAIVQPSATAVALLALDARLQLVSHIGERELPLSSFYVAPKKDITREHSLFPGEVIRSVVIPGKMLQYKNGYAKIKEKQSFDWPLADVAIALKMEGEAIADARVVLGSAAPGPWRARIGESVMNGSKISEKLFRAAAEESMVDAEPLAKNGYKVAIFKTIIYRTLCRLTGIEAKM